MILLANLKDKIKALIIESGWNMTSVIEELNKRGYNESLSNLGNKLRNETIKHKEILDILEIIGYEFSYNLKSE